MRLRPFRQLGWRIGFAVGMFASALCACIVDFDPGLLPPEPDASYLPFPEKDDPIHDALPLTLDDAEIDGDVSDAGVSDAATASSDARG
jgi:hypothetical protein